MNTDAFNKLIEEYKTGVANLQEAKRGKFGAFLAEALKENPDIKFLGFDCYTPYFNDGDPCEYSVYSNMRYPDWEFDEDGEFSEGYCRGLHNFIDSDEARRDERLDYLRALDASYDLVHETPYKEREEVHGDSLYMRVQKLSGAASGAVLHDIWMATVGDPVVAFVYLDGDEVRFWTEEYDHD